MITHNQVLNEQLRRQIKLVPVFHLFLLLTLTLTGFISLGYSVYATFEVFRTCPVLNVYFVLVWFLMGLSIFQSCLGLFTLIGFTVLALCQPRHKQEFNQQPGLKYIVGAVGDTGRFFPHEIHSTSSVLIKELGTNKSAYEIDDSNFDKIDKIIFPEGKRKPSCTDCQYKFGWLQPVTISLVIVIVGHLITFIMAQIFAQQVNHGNFESQFLNLFVEAKLEYAEAFDSQSTYRRTSSFDCLNAIQDHHQCCGVHQYTDWLTHERIIRINLSTFPTSCKLTSTNYATQSSNSTTLANKEVMFHKTGCLDPIRNRLLLHLLCIRILSMGIAILLSITLLSDLIYTVKLAHILITQNSENPPINH